MSSSASNGDLARKRSRSPSPTSTSKQVKLETPAGETSETSKPNEGDAPKPVAIEPSTQDNKMMQTDEDVSLPASTPAAAPVTTTAATTTTSPPAAADTDAVPMETDQPATAASTDAADATGAAAPAASPAQTIQMRALIVTQDASIIIGKGGKNVNEIREKSGSKVTITEAVPGNPERVMLISGQLDAVSKAFGLVVRRINDEPFDVPSVPGSRAVTIRFIIPNARMGSVIGKAGAKIKEIQEASGARLQASESMLPGSTERVLSVSGVADAIHIAVYYVGTVLLEAGPLPAVSTQTSRPSYRDDRPRGGHAPPPAAPPGSQTQQIYIPNELVGSIIGKAGAKINEIRQTSQCVIKINEPGEGSPGANPSERLVTITGPQSGIQVAVRLLYQRLEQERDKKSQMSM